MVDQRHPEAAQALKDAELDLLHLEQTFKVRDETEQEKRAAMQHEIDNCLLTRDGACLGFLSVCLDCVVPCTCCSLQFLSLRGLLLFVCYLLASNLFCSCVHLLRASRLLPSIQGLLLLLLLLPTSFSCQTQHPREAFRHLPSPVTLPAAAGVAVMLPANTHTRSFTRRRLALQVLAHWRVQLVAPLLLLLLPLCQCYP